MFTPAVKTMLGRLRSMKDQDDLRKVLEYSSEMLRSQPVSEELMKELLKMALEWQKSNEVHFEPFNAFLERIGVAPMGGMEAMLD